MRESLKESCDEQHRRGTDSRDVVCRHRSDQEHADCCEPDCRQQGRPPAVLVGPPAEQDASERAHQKPRAEHHEGREQCRRRVGRVEHLSGEERCEYRIDRPVVALKRVPQRHADQRPLPFRGRVVGAGRCLDGGLMRMHRNGWLHVCTSMSTAGRLEPTAPSLFARTCGAGHAIGTTGNRPNTNIRMQQSN